MEPGRGDQAASASSSHSLEDSSINLAYERAAVNQLPVPTFRASESQKAPRLVHVDDLARWLDEQRARAREQ